MENWRQIWIWFEGNFKGFRMQTKVFKAVFDWISKQQLNFLTFLSDCSCRKLGLTDLLGHDRTAMPVNEIICNSYWKYCGRNRDYCSHFSVTFKTTGTFLSVFVRLILGKVGVGRYTGPRQKSDIRQEFDLKVL